MLYLSLCRCIQKLCKIIFGYVVSLFSCYLSLLFMLVYMPVYSVLLGPAERACDEFISRWCRENRLVINSSKCVSIKFATSHSVTDLMLLKNRNIENHHKFLRVTVSENLKLNGHTDVLATELSSALFCICRPSMVIDEDHLKSIYYRKFQSLLLYRAVF
uniref:Uncharacterized protein n=1 Tax=Lygus hesperus TaxID=30085 RepID=A0A146LNL8_LYGHE